MSDATGSDARYDRNLSELLQELRVTQTGTQILFAFLLTISYTGTFRAADRFVHITYSITLVICALATAGLIAPVAIHRAVFRRGLRAPLIALSSRLALSGVYLLMLAMAGTLLLALDAALTRPTAIAVTAAVLAVFVTLWLGVPLRWRRPGSR